MKNLIKFVVVFSFAACVSKSKNNSTDQVVSTGRSMTLQLIDSLGSITLSVPNRYDTNFKWVHYSDCGKPCDEQKYRFQSNQLPITMETGWLWLDTQKDSVDRLTISHKMSFPFHDADSSLNLGMHGHLKEQFLSVMGTKKLVIDTLQKINGRYFSIFAAESSDSVQSKQVLAVTTIKSNEIRFRFELLKSQRDSITDNFVKSSLEVIKTLHLSQGL